MASIIMETSVPSNGAAPLVRQGADPSATLTAAKTATALAVTDAIPVTAALAVLVADGANPTQAHVTTLNTAYTTLIADIAAANTAVATAQAAIPSGDVALTINTANVVQKFQLTQALRAFSFYVRGLGAIPE